MSNRTLSKREFETLSHFRYQLRRFLRFSEDLTRDEGVTNLQYLLLLHIKGFPERDWATVGELAEKLQAQPHGAVALVNRCVKLGLVRRQPGRKDRREVAPG
jgi:DNA-binding MarR family transcriptional regulator